MRTLEWFGFAFINTMGNDTPLFGGDEQVLKKRKRKVHIFFFAIFFLVLFIPCGTAIIYVTFKSNNSALHI